MGNKELKAWERIKTTVERSDGDSDITKPKDLDIVEKALNDIDKLKQENEMLTGFGTHFFDESFKQNAVLVIIKKRFTIQFCKSDLDNYYGIMQIGINPIYIKTKQEFDLLKEVLLWAKNQ